MHASRTHPLRSRRRICTATLMLGLLSAHTAFADKSAELAERLMRTAQGSSIDEAGLKPWHMKLEVQLFDAKGKPTEEGTIEEWWMRPGMTKVVYTTPSYKSTEIEQDNHLFRTKDTDSPPSMLQTLLDQAVHPMPSKREVAESTPTFHKSNLGKVDLDCIMLDQDIKGEDPFPLGLFPTYCLDRGKDNLRVAYEYGSQTVLRDNEGKFQGKSLATLIGIRTNSVKVASGHIVALGTQTMTEADFAPTPEMEDASVGVTRVSGNVMGGMMLNKVAPTYPESAIQRHIKGDIVIGAIIGRDGRVRSLHLVKALDGDLAIAALLAVRQWRYTPYRLNGKPVEVETTITIHFGLTAGV